MVNDSYERIKQQLTQMLAMQNDVNVKLIGTDDWRSANVPFYRAIWTESSELLDHIGWKWWKKQETDLKQAQMEIVDIWHFGLSDMLQKKPNMLDESIVTMVKAINSISVSSPKTIKDKKELLADIEIFVKNTISNREFNVYEFLELAAGLDLDFDNIYRLYVGKAVLNKFRQDFGYKTGTYIKIWDGREDNEHLRDILDAMPHDTQDAHEYIFTKLTEAYPAN